MAEATTTATPAPATPTAAPAAAAQTPAAPAPAAAPAAAPASPGATPTPAPATPGATPTPEAAPAAPESATSLLSEAGKPAPEAPPAEAKPADPAAQTPPEAPVVYEPWKAPEGITLSEADTKPFNDILAGLKAPQEVGQQLIDLHVAEINKIREGISAEQQNVWKTTREGWVNDVRADKEVGGSRLNTALESAGALIEQYGGTPEQRAELREILAVTGAGDHRALVRLFNNLGKALALEGTPVPAFAPVPQKLTRAERRYSRSLPNGAAQ